MSKPAVEAQLFTVYVDDNPSMKERYDLIGDTHGHADVLEALLRQLGYLRQGAGYRHPEGRTVIFLGDYIDRGPRIRRVLEIVRTMVEAGEALALMGNHEFNAIAFHTPDGHGGWLREHSEDKIGQHRATTEQLVNPHPAEWRTWIDWFRGLPLYLELPGLRAVHASWSDQAVGKVRELGQLDEALLRAMADKHSDVGNARNLLLNGPELSLPEGHTFRDKSGSLRSDIRLRWWDDPRGGTYRKMVFPGSDAVPDLPIPLNVVAEHRPYSPDAPPVFIGHYWLPTNSRPGPVAINIACLDYSVAKGGNLTAYRWDGERALNRDQFVSTPHP